MTRSPSPEMVGRAEAHNISVLLMKYFCEMIQTSSDWGKRERGDLIEIEWENGGGRWRSTAGSWNQQINTPTIPKRRRFSGRNRHHRLSWRRQIHCKSYSPVSMPFFFLLIFLMEILVVIMLLRLSEITWTNIFHSIVLFLIWIICIGL